MPLAAVASIVAGASGLAAATTVMGTIASIGGIVGGIGVLTKSRELTALGAIAGLAGGVGAFAQGQGWLNSSSALETASSAAGESGIARMINTPSGVEAGLDASNASSAGYVNGADLASDQAARGGLFNADQPTASALHPTDGLTRSASEMATQSSPLAGNESPSLFNAARDSQAANVDIGADALAGYRAPGATPGGLSVNGINYGARSGGGSILDTLSQFGQWMERNKTISSIAANFIGGAFDRTRQAQRDLLNAQTQTLQAQLANASAVPQMNFTTRMPAGGVFPQTAPTYQPVRPAGLFNAR